MWERESEKEEERWARERKIRRRIRSSRFARRRSKGQRRVIGIFRAVIGDMLLGAKEKEEGVVMVAVWL